MIEVTIDIILQQHTEVDSLHTIPIDEKPTASVKKSVYSNLLKRLPSDSSLKSDAISLTEDMTAFDSKPPEGDKVSL